MLNADHVIKKDEPNDLVLNHSVLICVCLCTLLFPLMAVLAPPPSTKMGLSVLVLANFVLYLCLIFFLYFFGYLLHAVL